MKNNRLIITAGLALVASPACVAVKNDTEAAEQRTASAIKLANGVTYKRADLAGSGGLTKWWISFGVARSQGEADVAVACSSALDLEAREIDFEFADSSSSKYSEIIAGDFQSRAQAEARLNSRQLSSTCMAQIKASGLYPSDSSYPTLIHMIMIDPFRFSGELIAARGDSAAAGVSKPSVVMQSRSALAATNGGFFVMEEADGIVGESAGISVLNGSLQSEATRGRPWVEISNYPKIKVTIRRGEPEKGPALIGADGRRIPLDGVNRKPGLLRNCGALINRSFEAPVHDFTCKPDDELIAFTPASGLRGFAQRGHAVYELRADGTLKLSDGLYGLAHASTQLVASGRRRVELQSLAEQGVTLKLSMGQFERGRRASRVYAVNGGPTLVAEGRVMRLAGAQGWPFLGATRAQAGEIHKFVSLRAPRTAIGTTASGQIILVVVDGWRYRTDKMPPLPMNGGATLDELAVIMLELGAVEAINLDGGGSSVMAFRGAVASNPSDDQGERLVGDSLLLMSSGR
jgi:Phosphodiester glycosidase